jgi:prepilin-type processing-associated H-X9-DG protein
LADCEWDYLGDINFLKVKDQAYPEDGNGYRHGGVANILFCDGHTEIRKEPPIGAKPPADVYELLRVW